MRPASQSLPLTPATATRHLRPVVTDWLARAVRLPGRRRTCTPEVVRKVVPFAAAFARSAAAARAATPAAPSGRAVRDCLRAALPARRRTLGRRRLPALHAPLGKRRRVARVAIDCRRIGSVGEPNRDATRAESSAGTRTVRTRATARVVGGPGRDTLGPTAVGEEEPFAAVLARPPDRAAAAGVAPRAVPPDRAFSPVAVRRRLRSRNVPVAIPAAIRGRKPRPGVKAVGLRAVRHRGAGRDPHTREDRGASVRVTVVVARESDRHRKTGRRHARQLPDAAWRVAGAPVSIRDVYRTRFGVASSYRQSGRVRPRTPTTGGVIRLLWVAVGRIPRNARVRFGAGAGSRGTPAAACLVLLAEALATGPGQRSPAGPAHCHASPPT